MFHKFDPKNSYTYVVYGRMSSDRQNPRSPDQQFENVEIVIKRLGYSWVRLKTYRDDGKTGKIMRNRKGLGSLLEDIRTGKVKPDLLLVDSHERLGRSEEIPTLRKELQNKYGVLVLTADTNFADPTTPTGQLLGAFESFRATDANRLKGLEVSRGKRDVAITYKYWPGGVPPFGYRFESVTENREGKLVVLGHRLVEDPITAAVLKLAFSLARDKGFGASRIARCLNNDSQIPDDLKPFVYSKVAYWLQNDIYKGTFVWGRRASAVVDDTIIRKRRPESELLIIEDFCTPLVSKSDWQEVYELRRSRAEVVRRQRGIKKAEKLIVPAIFGLSLHYPLTGLVRCSDCGRAMVPGSSQKYQLKGTGEQKKYVSYHCPGNSLGGACDNKKRIPEVWLRNMVASVIKKRLFE